MNHGLIMNPLAKKLQIKPGKCWLFYNAPQNYLATLEPLPEGTQAKFTPEGNFDGVQLFATDSIELAAGLKMIAPLLKADTVFWIAYPKKSSGIKSDLEMMGSWDEPRKYGLTTVASVAINDIWTGIRLKPEGQLKVSEFRNEAIKKNEYAAFIDLENRQITLPPDMKQVVEKSTNALAFYHTLSFSNKKEYVVWILSAKQEKTRTERLDKIVDKLSAGKKNPSEK
jgi:bacteriocin resistance YdeI/OmpD-like protein